MSKLGQLRIAVAYRRNVPRCETCEHYRKPSVYLTTNSLTARSKPMCTQHHFDVQPNAVCDKWAGKP